MGNVRQERQALRQSIIEGVDSALPVREGLRWSVSVRPDAKGVDRLVIRLYNTGTSAQGEGQQSDAPVPS